MDRTSLIVPHAKKHKETTPLKSVLPSNSSVENNKDKGTVQLNREVGLVRGVALIVGAMIGSGIFISPKGILLGTQSVGMSLVVWMVCAVVSTLGAMCYAELGTVIQRSGGAYQYILHAYGNLPAFLVMWCTTVILHPSGGAMIAITLGTYIADYLIAGDCAPPNEATQLFAIVTVMSIVFINCVSVRWTSGLAVVFCGAKVIALTVIIVVEKDALWILVVAADTLVDSIVVNDILKLFCPCSDLYEQCKRTGMSAAESPIKGQTQYLDPRVSFDGSTTNILSYSTALYYGFWAYFGWDILNNVSEEMVNPERNIPLAIGIAIPTVTTIYLLTNVAYFTTVSPDEVLASSAVAVTFAERTLGPMAWLIPLGVCMSTAGSLLVSFLASPRQTFAAGREGHMLQVMSMVNVKVLTPLPAEIFHGALVIIYILIGDFDSILVFSGFVSWMVYGITFTSVLVLRRKYPDAPRPFKVNFMVPILAVLVSMFMIVAPVISQPSLEYLYILPMLVLGLAVYGVFVWGKRQLPFIDHVTLFFQKLLLVSPSSD